MATKLKSTKNKNKTRKSAAKRFLVTGGKVPKVMRRSQHTRHLQSSKSKRQQRALKQENVVEGKMHKKVLQMLGQA